MSPRLSDWIAVVDRLPEHRQEVLVWCGYVQLASFCSTAWDDRGCTRDDVIRDMTKFYVEHDIGYTAEQIAEDIDSRSPSEPYFRWGGGDADTIWRASRGFACDDACYGEQPPITHWMPLPEAP